MVIGLSCLTVIIFLISGVYLFRPGYHVNARYDYVSILDKGAPIRMAGVKIGEVSNVNLLFDEKDSKVRVNIEMFIEKSVRIHQNYLFKIQGTHVLSEPHIEITPVPGTEPLVTDGQILEGVPLLPIEALIDNVSKITKDFSTLMGPEGDLGKAIQHVSTTTQSMDEILTKIKNGEGTVGSLVYKDDLYQEVRGLVSEIKAHPWRLLKKDDGKKFLFF